jgi:hypothetical protein
VILTEKRVTYQKEIVRFNDVIKNLLKKRHPFMTDELRTKWVKQRLKQQSISNTKALEL